MVRNTVPKTLRVNQASRETGGEIKVILPSLIFHCPCLCASTSIYALSVSFFHLLFLAFSDFFFISKNYDVRSVLSHQTTMRNPDKESADCRLLSTQHVMGILLLISLLMQRTVSMENPRHHVPLHALTVQTSHILMTL